MTASKKKLTPSNPRMNQLIMIVACARKEMEQIKLNCKHTFDKRSLKETGVSGIYNARLGYYGIACSKCSLNRRFFVKEDDCPCCGGSLVEASPVETMDAEIFACSRCSLVLATNYRI